jgi:hypothetical protein
MIIGENGRTMTGYRRFDLTDLEFPSARENKYKCPSRESRTRSNLLQIEPIVQGRDSPK